MEATEKLIPLIQSDSKHGNYQYLPPKLVERYPHLQALNYNNMRLDDKRYAYFTSKLNFDHKRVTDIGANIGYFSFRLASEHAADVTLYEPYTNHSLAIDEIASLLQLSSQQVQNINKGIDMKSVDSLEKCDILLFFNVIQHAGEDFDSDNVQSSKEWRKYAVEFLKRLRSKCEYMVFQTGYSWLGNKNELCSKKEIVSFTYDLLSEAGWEVMNCGIVQNFKTCEYQDINPKATVHPLMTPFKFLEYGVKYRLGCKVPNHRFIQRPIYICKS
jgi:hypothetical protein